MLWAECDDWRFADQSRQPFLVTRREPVVASGQNMVQLIQWVAIGAPGFPFLVSAEQVAGSVKHQRVGHADACGDGFHCLAIARKLLNGAAFPLKVIMRYAVFDAIRVGIIRGDQAEIDVSRSVECHGRGIHAA